jgi:regulator of sirC expression with transglutaminase-like and TPR domain
MTVPPSPPAPPPLPKRKSAGPLAALVERVDATPEEIATLIARDAHPQLGAGEITAALDGIASDFPTLGPELDGAEISAVAVHHIGTVHGFRGDDRDYYAAENSYVDNVLRTKRGIPVTLSVVYAGVLSRVGVPVEIIGFPARVLLRVARADGVYVDPFAARVVLRAELPSLLESLVGSSATLRPEHLLALSPRDLAARILLNLKRIHETRKDVASAFQVTDRLVEIAPTPELRRDRGLFALSLRAHRIASADLAHYLLKRPDARDAKSIRASLAGARKDPPPAN